MSILQKKVSDMTLADNLKLQGYSLAVLAGTYTLAYGGYFAYCKVADHFASRKLRKKIQDES